MTTPEKTDSNTMSMILAYSKISDRLAAGGMVVWVALILLWGISMGAGWFGDTAGSIGFGVLILLSPLLLLCVIATRFWTYSKALRALEWRGAVRRKKDEFKQESLGAVGPVVTVLSVAAGLTLLTWGGASVAPALFPESAWAYDFHNEFVGGRPPGTYEFVIINKPRDCEFMSAPLGNKNCHYEKDVSEPIDVSGADTEREYRIIVSWNYVED